MAGIFGEFFLVSVSHKTKHEKSSKNSGKIRRKIQGKNSGRKLEKFGKLSFCNFPDLKKSPHLAWGVFTFQCFVFFLIFAFFCLSFPSSPLLLDFLKPKSGPSNEVMGNTFVCFGAQESMLLPGKCRTRRASARRIASSRNPSERKRHINSFHINFLCRPLAPGVVPGAKPGLSQGTNPALPGFQCVK